MVNRTNSFQATAIEIHRPIIRKAFGIAATIVLLMASATTLSAQTFRGTILGTVTDPNGAVVPAATVTAKNVGTGIERTTTSDENGSYSLPELQTGTYQVTVKKDG